MPQLTLFTATTALEGTEPWITDGTPAGTLRLRDIRPGPASSDAGNYARLDGGRVLFQATDSEGRPALYVTDGTSTGTVRLATLAAAASGPLQYLSTSLGARAIFRVSDPTGAIDLWSSDGTAVGTFKLQSFAYAADPLTAEAIIATGGGRAVYFQSGPGPGHDTLWTTDGTPAGTAPKDLGVNRVGGISPISGGRAVFPTSTVSGQREQWVTDGTVAGTRPVSDVPGGVTDTTPRGTPLGDGRYVFGDTRRPFDITSRYFNGSVVRITDTAGANPVILANISDTLRPDIPYGFVALGGGRFVFAAPAPGGSVSDTLWASDGTETGTAPLRPIVPRSTVSTLSSGYAVFVTDDGRGPEPWATDGTSDGTMPLADINPGAPGSNPHDFLPLQPIPPATNPAVQTFAGLATDGVANTLFVGTTVHDVMAANGTRRGADYALLINGDVKVTRPNRTDLLRGVEEMRFIDGRMVFDASDPAAAVTRLYQAGLGRPPDQGGLNFWIASLQSGTPLADLASSFEASAEFTTRFGTGLSNTDFVTRIYQNVLGRDPDAAGLEFWRGNLDSNAATRGQTLAGISESNENKVVTAPLVAGGIWDVSETAAQVARLYDTALGRLPDAGGLGFWTKAIDNGGALLDLANGFLDSPEFRSTYGALDNWGFVSKLYDNTLHRPADAGGLDFWAGRLGAGTPRAQVVIGFSESSEHQTNTMPNIMNNDPGSYGIKVA